MKRRVKTAGKIRSVRKNMQKSSRVAKVGNCWGYSVVAYVDGHVWPPGCHESGPAYSTEGNARRGLERFEADMRELWA